MLSSNRLKILFDENIPIKVIELLKEKGFDVNVVPLGLTDKEISKLAKEESRVILTFDKHFINKRLFPPSEYSGIVLIDLHPPLIDVVFSSLLQLFEDREPEKFKGKLFIISSLGLRIKS